MGTNSLAMLPWFPRDFIASTRAMRLAERGAYRDLLDYQWEMGKLPADHERLARLLGCSRHEFDEVWPGIADKFVRVGAHISNKRLEEHRKKALEQRERKVKAARETNAKRYGEREKQPSDSDSLSDTVSDPLSASPPSPSPSEESLLDISSDSDTSQARSKSRADVAEPIASREERGKNGSRIPLPFPISEAMTEWAHANTPNVNVKAATAEFEDYWRGIPGQRGRKTDWPATWRNRMREQQGKANRPNGNGSHAAPVKFAKSPGELEAEAIENAITAGKSDREIHAEINSQFVSLDDIRRKREEMQHAQH